MNHTETASQVAEQLGVNAKTIRSWAREGCPRTKGKGGRYLFDVAETFSWAQKAAKQFHPGRPRDANTSALAQARERKENALAARYEFELKKAQGEYVSKVEIQEEMSLILHALKRTVLDGPKSIQPPLPRPIRDKVDKALRAALRECVTAMEAAVADTPS